MQILPKFQIIGWNQLEAYAWVVDPKKEMLNGVMVQFN